MITVDQFMDIKSRNENGQSNRSIVADTGSSRNTVRQVLRGEHPIETGKARAAPKPRSSRLDPFKDYIRKRVQEFDLSAVRIRPEIKSMGFQGGLHTVRRFI